MDASDAHDGTDFRPFFDMVIGILFVRLILVAAQIYFQQAQVDTVASDAAKREAVLRRSDISAFLDALAARLRAVGLTATADADSGAVLLPPRDVMVVDAGGLPAVKGTPADEFGAAVAGLTGCVTLPRNRFGDLGSALLSARIMGGDPQLVGASNAAGGRLVSFDRADERRASPRTRARVRRRSRARLHVQVKAKASDRSRRPGRNWTPARPNGTGRQGRPLALLGWC